MSAVTIDFSKSGRGLTFSCQAYSFESSGRGLMILAVCNNLLLFILLSADQLGKVMAELDRSLFTFQVLSLPSYTP